VVKIECTAMRGQRGVPQRLHLLNTNPNLSSRFHRAFSPLTRRRSARIQAPAPVTLKLRCRICIPFRPACQCKGLITLKQCELCPTGRCEHIACLLQRQFTPYHIQGWWCCLSSDCVHLSLAHVFFHFDQRLTAAFSPCPVPCISAAEQTPTICWASGSRFERLHGGTYKASAALLQFQPSAYCYSPHCWTNPPG
jgi:hypothetical protein